MTFQEVYNNGSVAQVNVSGALRDLNLAMESEFSNEVVVINTKGTWLVCASCRVSDYIPSSFIQQHPFSVQLGGVYVGQQATQKLQEYERQTVDYNGNIARALSEGWQYVALELVLEKTGVEAQGVWGPVRMTGKVVDSGGFERDFSFTNCLMLCGKHTYRNRFLVQGMRHIWPVYVEIPQNQMPVAIEVSFDDYAPIHFSIPQDIHPELITLPVEPLAVVPIVTDGVITTSMADTYEMSISNFQFEPNPFHEGKVTLNYSMSVKNLGGFDLTRLEHPPGILAFDDLGNYYDDFELSIGSIGIVPPGMTKSDDDALLFVMGEPFVDFTWLWVVVINPYGVPIAQLQILADGTLLSTITSDESLFPSTATPTPTVTLTPTNTATPIATITPTPTASDTPTLISGVMCLSDVTSVAELERAIFDSPSNRADTITRERLQTGQSVQVLEQVMVSGRLWSRINADVSGQNFEGWAIGIPPCPPTITPAPAAKCTLTLATTANLRREPQITSERVASIDGGSSVDVLDQRTGSLDGRQWSYVVTQDGTEGWARDLPVCP